MSITINVTVVTIFVLLSSLSVLFLLVQLICSGFSYSIRLGNQSPERVAQQDC